MRGEGIDDGKGTYLRSTVSMRWRLAINDPLPLSDESVRRLEGEVRASAWDYLQTFLRTYAYAAKHLEATLVLKPEDWTLDVLDPATGRTVQGFPQIHGSVLPGPIAPKRTLTNGGLGQIDAVLAGAFSIPLPDQLLLRAEAAVTLLDDLDHAILDVAAALEIFIDQLIEHELQYAPDPKLVLKLKRRGIYDAYDGALRALGRPSLKDSHPSVHPDYAPLNFETLEFIFVVRNNIIHKGVRQFTLGGFGKRYKSPYTDRHKRFDGKIVQQPDVLGLVRRAGSIIDWILSSTPSRQIRLRERAGSKEPLSALGPPSEMPRTEPSASFKWYFAPLALSTSAMRLSGCRHQGPLHGSFNKLSHRREVFRRQELSPGEGERPDAALLRHDGLGERNAVFGGETPE